MDPLSDILALVQPVTYATGGLSAGDDWGVQFPAHGMVKCYSVVRGCCWLSVEDVEQPIPLQAGSCFLLPKGRPFSLSSDRSQQLTSWTTLSQQSRYNGILALTPGEDFLILGSHFRLEGDARMLLDALPPVVLLESEAQQESLQWAVERLLREMRDPKPGGTFIAQQIACTMLVEALRLHVAEGTQSPGWLAAICDVRLRPALACMHRDPARAWTLAALAHASGLSRTAFAQRFREKVGKTPMEYLTHWRMAVAAKLLRNEKSAVSSVARAVGYKSESAFSAAFKKPRGSSPRMFLRGERSVQSS